MFTRGVRVHLNTDTRAHTSVQLCIFSFPIFTSSFSLKQTQVLEQNPTKSRSCRSSMCHLELNSRIKRPQQRPVPLRHMRAKSTWKKRTRGLSKPPFNAACEPSLISHLTNKQPKDLHRLSSAQKSIQPRWQTFVTYWSQIKEKESHKNRQDVQQFGTWRLFHRAPEMQLKCQRNQTQNMRAMLWFYTALHAYYNISKDLCMSGRKLKMMVMKTQEG